ncbi:MAG: hypothetical protein NVSMB31_01440 [Vulcanimicrobiaceae bacterium]
MANDEYQFPIGIAGEIEVLLPIGAAAGRFVELGKSGYGKTNGDAVMIEGFVTGGATTIVADPLGQMYGLRASKDGESPGLEIAVLGGTHGDLPLPLEQAEYFADMLGEGVSAVLDLSLIEAELHEQFMAKFLPRLMQRVKQIGTPLHVNFQEADRFAPQRGGATPTAVTRWARACRNEGMGWSFSTHKPQILDKVILETANAFVAYRMTGDLAQQAIGAHVGSLIGKNLAGKMIEELPKFRKGEAWFVPDSDWLDDGIDWTPKRVQFKLRDTFEIRPPKFGQVRRGPKKLADVANIDALRRNLEKAQQKPLTFTGTTAANEPRIEYVEKLVERVVESPHADA